MAELIVISSLFLAVLVILAHSHRNTVNALIAQNRDLLKAVSALSERAPAVSLAHTMERSDAQAQPRNDRQLTQREMLERYPLAGSSP